LGDRAGATGTVTVQRAGAGRALTAQINADLAAALPARLAPLAEGQTTLSLDATFGDDGRIAISRADLDGAAARLQAGGSYEAGGAIAAKAHAELGRVARFAAFVPPGINWSAITLDLTAAGTVAQPSLRAVVDARDLAAERLTARSVGLNLDLSA